MPAPGDASATVSPGAAQDGRALLAPEDRHKVLVLWNRTDAPYPRHRCLDALLLEALRRGDPTAEALREDRRGEAVTRGDLVRRAVQVAGLLRALGAGPRRVVAVAAADPAAAAGGVVAALLAGAAAAPLDLDWPLEALARAQGALAPSIVLGDDLARRRLPRPLPRALWLDGLPGPPRDAEPVPPRTSVGPTDPALALYVPDLGGVTRVSHRAALAHLHALVVAHGAPRCVLPLHRHPHAAWVGALLWALSSGGAVALPAPGDVDVPAALASLARRAGVTHVVGPAHRHARLLAAARDDDLASLVGAVLDGVTPALVARHRARCPGARLWSVLTLPGAPGPTVSHEVGPAERDDALPPLGRPMANVRCYVLDGRGEPTPPGVTGELWIGGDVVGAEHDGRPELEPARDPFRGDDPDARVVRTGVQARWRPDGSLERADAPPPRPSAPARTAPLAPTQEVFWLHEQLEPGSTAYAVVACACLRGELDGPAMAAATAALAHRHDALRVRLVPGPGGAPLQEVLAPEDVRLGLEVHDVAEDLDPTRAAQALLARAARTPLALDAAPLARALLVRAGPREHLLGLVLHHAISDGTSIEALLDDLGRTYAAARRGEDPAGAPPPAGSWIEATRALRARLEAREAALVERWRGRLEGAPAPVAVPGDRPRADRPPGARAAGRVVRDLDERLCARLRALARERGVTPAVVALAAFDLVLHRWSGEADVVHGAAVSLRDRPELSSAVGCLVGSAFVRVVVEPDAGFDVLLGRARAALLDAVSDGLLPVPALLAALRRPGPAFHVLFNALPPRPTLEGWAPLEADLLDVEDPASPLDLTLYVHDQGPRLRLEVVHDAWLIEPARAAALAAQVEAVLRQAAQGPARAVGDFDLVTDDARAALPDPRADLDDATPAPTLHGLVAAQAAKTPRRLAIVDPRRAWSYEHLAARAADVARALRRAGVRPGDRVAVWAARGAPLAASLLGVLRAGAAFAVLDPEHPAARLARQVEVLWPVALLAIDEAGPLPAEVLAALRGAPVVEVQADAPPDDHPDEGALADDATAVAYVAFTSGTTGRPRAVVGAHAPVTRFLEWQRTRYGLHEDDRVAVLSGLGHDPLLRDLFAPLSIGASARAPAPEARRDPELLLDWLREERVTVVHVTPGLLGVLVAAPGAAGALPDLRLVFSGGDRLTRRDVDRLRSIAPRAKVVSLYGTTETPQGMGFFEADAPDEPARGCPSAVLPAGRGIDGVQLLVLGPRGAPAGVGELGEVHVRTPRLTLGYLGDDESARARYLPGPSARGPGDRMFRTGDLGRHRPDGLVEIVQRADRQVKVRGHRVELGEVEAALGAAPGVERAVAALRDGAAGPRLLAWVRPAPGVALDGDALRRGLAATLPEAAVPSAVVVLPAWEPWPLTPNAKLDVARLPEPTKRPRDDRPGELPRTQLEQRIAALWQELLQRERVRVDDDFFALGGNSLLAVRMLGALSERLGAVVPVSLLQRAPTVRALARALYALEGGPEEPLVVEGQPGAGLAPLWVLHPAGGHVVFVRGLAAKIDPAWPVLGIQAQGLDGRRPPLTTVDAMVSRYLALVRARQPEGPYHLAGPSFGGLLAWEMARRLAAEGHEVGLLALLDTFGPGYPRRRALPRRLLDHALSVARLPGWPARRDYLAARARDVRARVRGLAPRRLQVRDAAPGAAAGQGALVDAVRRVIETNYAASARHEPGEYAGRVLLVRATRRPSMPGLAFDDPTNGWRAQARGGVVVRTVDATHQRLMDPPALDEVARMLDEALRGLA